MDIDNKERIKVVYRTSTITEYNNSHVYITVGVVHGGDLINPYDKTYSVQFGIYIEQKR